MSLENPLVNNTPPKLESINEILEALREQITSVRNPDEYLLREAKPTLDQQLHRTKAAEANRTDRLS